MSELAQLEVMFDTKLDAPGEQPVGVTMIDGYNLMHRVSASCALKQGWYPSSVSVSVSVPG